MVSRLRPLEVNMVFEDRSYKLGDVIDIDLELSARRDVVIREGRVDLDEGAFARGHRADVTHPRRIRGE